MTYVHTNCWTPFVGLAQRRNSSPSRELRPRAVDKVRFARNLPCRYLAGDPEVGTDEPRGTYRVTPGEVPRNPMVSNVTVSTVEVSPEGVENGREGVRRFWQKFFPSVGHVRLSAGFSHHRLPPPAARQAVPQSCNAQDSVSGEIRPHPPGCGSPRSSDSARACRFASS